MSKDQRNGSRNSTKCKHNSENTAIKGPIQKQVRKLEKKVHWVGKTINLRHTK